MAGRRYYKKLAILAKKETLYGTDAAPAAANAIQMTDATLTPIEGTEVTRDLLRPFLGQQGAELVNTFARLEGAVEMAGAGAAGTVPAWGILMRLCGFAEVVTAGQSVVYAPISENFESGSLYFNRDGVRHILLGARGTISLSLAPAQIPRFRFNLTGMLGPIGDQPLPSVDYSAFKRPPVVNKANTTMSILGWNAVAESISIDAANAIEPRFLIGDEAIELTDRQATGSLVVEARSLQTVNWFEKALTRQRGAMSIVHGKTAGNIIQIDSAGVEIGRPTEGQTQNIMNYTIPLMLCPSDAGNDELIITVK